MNPPGLRKLLRGFEAALITAMVAGAFPSLAAKTPDPLQTAFATPPASAKPQVWWHWMDGNITKEGITADLEAMQRVGIGGATIINVAYGIPPGPVKFMSEEWRELVRHAVSEGKRLGLEIGIANCDGYSSSGGPWITPEYSMQQVVTSETQVKGGAAFSGTLAQPLTRMGYYQDIAVLAFPTPQGEQVKMSDAAPQATASANAADAGRVLDGKPETYLTLPLPSPGQPQSIEISFPQPFTAQALNVQGVMGPDVYMYGFSGYLEASEDGKTYRKIRDISYPEGRSKQPYGFEPVSARFFRLVITSAGRRSDKLALAELELSQRASMDNRTFKTDEQSNGTKALAPIVSAQPLPEQIIGLQNIVDLTSKMSPTGALNWQAPEGDWTILRIGHTITGVINHPATPGGRGLETDKLNPAATELHWNAMMAKVVKDNQPLVKNTLTHVLIDSYEVDSQNWTPRFREEFQKRHGYDLTPYLPALSGRFVGSPEMTDRFLWDLRRTVADLFSEAYFGHMSDLAHRDGLLAAYEPYGNGPFDSITSGGKADIPMGEFWAGGNAGPVLKMAASVAHLYGRSLAGAESFTATPQNGRWQQDPFSLKAVGDAAFCQGINHFSIHRYAHQPWLDRFPGMTMGPWGTHFERTLTWWNQGAGWVSYLARCQAMLQRGQFVGDILCFAGEHSPNEIPNFQSQIPSGYDYDVCNTEVLLQLQVRDGMLQAPHGMQYRLLVLPNQTSITPALARKIKELVIAGATVIGPRPVRSPSLEGYPQCDEEVAAIGREVWGDATGKTRHEFGKGKVIWGEPLEAVLQSDGVKPDFATANGKTDFRAIHRRDGASDIYFVATPTETAVDGTCTFRVSGKIPELWKPDTGAVGKAPVYSTEADGRMTVPLHFDPAGSVFVVFRQKEANADHAVAVARTDAGPFTKSQAPSFELSAGESGLPDLKAWQPGTYAITLASGKTVKADLSKVPAPMTVSGPWNLAFPPNWGAPANLTLEQLGSWTDQPDAGVRYFSGTATYRKEIDIPQALLGSGKLLRLDLGRVKNLAQVIFNGKDLGVLWKPPFTVDISPLARPGKNMLEVRVTNLWVNRLIGDEQLPADCQWKTRRERGKALQEWPQWFLEGKPSPTGRFTFTTWQHWTKEDAPLESGLLGPVTLQPGLEVPVQ